jgi:hypothetical protein
VFCSINVELVDRLHKQNVPENKDLKDLETNRCTVSAENYGESKDEFYQQCSNSEIPCASRSQPPLSRLWRGKARIS